MGQVIIGDIKFPDAQSLDIVSNNFYVNGQKVDIKNQFQSITVQVTGDVEIGKMQCNVLNVLDGSLKVNGKLEANSVDVGRDMHCYDVEANTIDVRGDLTCGDIDANTVSAKRRK